MHSFAPLIRLSIARAVLVWAAMLSSAGWLCAQDVSEPIHQRINRLIELLGDESYAVREQAQNELVEIGFAAFDALGAATEHEDLEIASRARYLLRLIRVQWVQENDPPEVQELLQDYEFQPSEERLERIRKLAHLPGGKGVPALCRLVRFEGSVLLSKYAAIQILDQEPVGRVGRDRWAKTLEDNLGHSRRPAADWLLGYLRLSDAAALPAWTRLVEAEELLQQRTPAESSPSIVTTLLYRLAETQARQGKQELAERTADRARRLNSVRNVAQLFAYLNTVYTLRRRGLFNWAEEEYRRVIDTGLPELKAIAHIGLAEMWHDQGNNLDAAETLQDLLQPGQSRNLRSLAAIGRDVGEVRARMGYFFACHWVKKGDRQKQREYLDQAVQADPAEIDVLIARHRLPDQSPEYRRKTVELITQAASTTRRQIQAEPDNPVHHNQFAWLIGNTAGDLDEALKHARKAVEMSPHNGAYYDTLAHVYFGKGDYENAVKHQAAAAELEPHSGLIIKQLKVFRNKLAEERKKETASRKQDKP